MDLRNQPHSREAERVVLAGLMYHDIWDEISEIVTEEDFFLPAHAEIFRAIESICSRGGKANPPTVATALGGARYIENPAELVGQIVTEAMGRISTLEYSHLLSDLSRKRVMIETAQEMMERAHGAEDADEIQQDIEKRLFQLAGNESRGPILIGDSVGEVLRAVEAASKAGGISGVPTGFTDLDRMLGGLHPSNLIILAGRPAMGKSALAENIATFAAKTIPTLFFSLEMSADELTGRALSTGTGIGTHDMRVGKADQAKLIAEGTNLASLKLLIDDRPSLSVSAIRNTTRRAIRKHGIKFVIVDYLQLMRERAESKVVEISEISRGLKALAKELKIPVLALSQLSRKVEERDDKRPLMSDLRESGSIEQDADIVLMLYREEYYLRHPEQGTKSDAKYANEVIAYNAAKAKCENLAQLIVAKNRHGPIGTVNLHFNADRVKFSNLDRYGMAA